MSRLSGCREELNDVLEKSPSCGDFLKYEVQIRDTSVTRVTNKLFITKIYRDPENHEEKKERKEDTLFLFKRISGM